jgi:hypothetical protein
MNLKRYSIGLALLLGASISAVASCSSVGPADSSETHFLSRCTTTCPDGLACVCGLCTRACDTTPNCASLAGGALCSTSAAAGLTCEAATGNVCDLGCSSAAECAGVGADLACVGGRCRPEAASTLPGVDACPSGCRPIRAYGHDRARDCVDTERSVLAGCDCNPMQGGGPGCVRWRADGSLWFAENTDDLRYTEDGEPAAPSDQGWDECTLEERRKLAVACDFARCEHGGASTCDREDTCATLGSAFSLACGGELSIFLADGCLRQACERTDECADGERCGFLASVTQPGCSYEVGRECLCGAPAIDRSGSYCFSEDAPVPGRDWSSFRFAQGAGPCPPESTCRWTWSVTPDGAVVTDKEGVPGAATLGAADLAEVDALVRSDEVLKNMVQGQFCGPPPTDVSISLTIDAGGPAPLEQDVTGCVFSGPDGDPIARLWEIVRVY